MKKPRRQSGLFDYLAASGALDLGSDAIEAGKRAYALKYKREYMQRHRQKRKEYRFVCTPEEEKLLQAAIKRHQCKESVFIKQAVLATVNQAYLLPDASTINSIKQTMLTTQSKIRRIAERDKGWFGTGKYGDVKDAISELQQTIHAAFAQPPRLEDALREQLRSSPSFRQTILNIISEYDSEISRQVG